MNKLTCPFCGRVTTEEVCPRCFARVKPAEEKSTKVEAPVKKGRKTNKEV